MKLGIELKSPWEALGIPLPAFKFNLETEAFRPAQKKALKGITDEAEHDRWVISQAHRDGYRGLPDRDDKEPNGIQRTLQQTCHDAAVHIEGVVKANVEVFITDLRRLEELELDSARIVQQYKSQFAAFLAAQKTRAVELARRYLEAERRLRDFKTANNLTREAVIASEDGSGWWIVLGVALLEFIVSLMLLTVALPGGAREAFAILLPVAVANVVMGMTAGFYGIRNLYREGRAWKGLGIAAILSMFGLAFYLNVKVAHVRDIVSNAAGTNIFAALREVVSEQGPAVGEIPTTLDGLPFGFTGIESLTFLLLGMITWGFAVWKGMNAFDDVVPGYSEVAQACQRARRERDNFYYLLRTGIHKENLGLLARLAEVRKNTLSGVNLLERQFVEQKQALIDSKARHDVLKEHTSNSIKNYREANRYARGRRRFFILKPIQPEGPAYFKEPVTVNSQISASYEDIEDEFKGMRERAKLTLNRLEKAITDLSEEMGRTVASLTGFEREVEAEALAEVTAIGVKAA